MQTLIVVDAQDEFSAGSRRMAAGAAAWLGRRRVADARGKGPTGHVTGLDDGAVARRPR